MNGMNRFTTGGTTMSELREKVDLLIEAWDDHADAVQGLEAARALEQQTGHRQTELLQEVVVLSGVLEQHETRYFITDDKRVLVISPDKVQLVKAERLEKEVRVPAKGRGMRTVSPPAGATPA